MKIGIALAVVATAFYFHSAPDPIQVCLDKTTQAKASPSPTPEPSYSLVSEQELSEQFKENCDLRGSLDGIRQALQYQIQRCEKFVPIFDKPKFQIACREFQRDDWCLKTNRRLLAIANTSKDVSSFLKRVRKEFDWYKSSGMAEPSSDGTFQKGETQFTGYYTPLLQASRTKQGSFRFPIYSKPNDLVEISADSPENCGLNSQGKPIKWCLRHEDGTYAPYFTRSEIEAGALAGRGLEIAYLSDPLDVAFMMIQGSATLELENPDGTKTWLRANYAGKNGRKLQMLGRIVRCDGGTKDDFSSMHGIKSYLNARPNRMQRLLDYDESFVFFRELSEGPLGSEEVPVTEAHSLAVDRDWVPPGAAVLFQVRKSDPGTCSMTSSLALAQDTGGAIKGAHVDWYLGAGEAAANAASALNSPGLIFIALPRNSGIPVRDCETKK